MIIPRMLHRPTQLALLREVCWVYCRRKCDMLYLGQGSFLLFLRLGVGVLSHTMRTKKAMVMRVLLGSAGAAEMGVAVPAVALLAVDVVHGVEAAALAVVALVAVADRRKRSAVLRLEIDKSYALNSQPSQSATV